MKSSKHLQWMVAVGALALALPLVAGGCGKGDDGSAPSPKGITPRGANGLATPPGGNSPAGNMPPGSNGAGSPPSPMGNGPSGNMPMGGGNSMPGRGASMPPGSSMPPPSMGSGPSGAGAGAGSAAASGDDAPIPFRQVKFAVRPKYIKKRPPHLDRTVDKNAALPVEYVVFRYRPRGDQEGLLPMLNQAPGAKGDNGIPWLVEMPRAATIGNKTRGEWENLFCTYVVPDTAAIKQAQVALQRKMDQLRRKLYANRVVFYNEDEGDDITSPKFARARAQMNDVVATAKDDRLQRAAMYCLCAAQSLKDGLPQEAKMFQIAALQSLGDLAFENGRDADALWLYQQLLKAK